MIPVLMITHNRLEYTKQALEALLKSKGICVHIIDNASTDGTREWLLQHFNSETQPGWNLSTFMSDNTGIAGAMNHFLNLYRGNKYLGKVDNDTIVPENWATVLLEALIANRLDAIQAKHHITPAVHPDGWNGFTRNMKTLQPGIFQHHFIGGSGIIFKTASVDRIPQTKWKLGGWRQYQRDHPQLRTAFCNYLSVELLDEHGYSDYPEYYKQTKRL